MKRFLFTLILISALCPLLLANGTEIVDSGSTDPEIPPVALFDLPDRVRNSVAISSPSDTMPMVYVASFGLADADATATQLEYEAPSLVRFNMMHSSGVITCPVYEREILDTNFISRNSAVDHLVCYTQAELTILQNDACNADNWANARYESGNGYWADPVLITDGNGTVQNLILLNKSGLLMSVDPDFYVGQTNMVNWAIDLRAEEGLAANVSAKKEYMATPIVVGQYIYVAGLQSVLRIDMTTHAVSHTLLLGNDDQFIASPTWDLAENGTAQIIVCSVNGDAFILEQDLTVAFQQGAITGNVVAEPVVDESGYILFSGDNLKATSQDRRSDDDDPFDTVTTLGSSDSGFRVTSILTGEKPLLYALTSNTSSGRLGFMQPNILNVYRKEVLNGADHLSVRRACYQTITSGSETYLLHNNGVLFDFDTPDCTAHTRVFQTYGNDFLNEPYEEVTGWYNLFSPDIASMNYTIVKVPYAMGVTPGFHTSLISGPTCTFGGLTPYKTNLLRRNIVVGDEQGKVWSYIGGCSWFHHVDLSDEILSGSVISDKGYPVFQRTVSKECTYQRVDDLQVTITDIPSMWNLQKVYFNGNKIDVNNHGEPTVSFTIDGLLQHPSYDVCISYNNGSGFVNYENMNLGTDAITISLQYDSNPVITGNELISTPGTYYFDSITVEDTGSLTLASGVNVHCPIFRLENGGELTVNTGAELHVDNAMLAKALPGSPATHSVVNQLGYIDIQNLLFDSAETTTSAMCKLVCNQTDCMNISFLTMPETDDELWIAQPSATGTGASVYIHDIASMSGTFTIDDKVETLTVSNEDGVTGSVTIGQNGSYTIGEGSEPAYGMCPMPSPWEDFGTLTLRGGFTLVASGENSSLFLGPGAHVNMHDYSRILVNGQAVLCVGENVTIEAQPNTGCYSSQICVEDGGLLELDAYDKFKLEGLTMQTAAGEGNPMSFSLDLSQSDASIIFDTCTFTRLAQVAVKGSYRSLCLKHSDFDQLNKAVYIESSPANRPVVITDCEFTRSVWALSLKSVDCFIEESIFGSELVPGMGNNTAINARYSDIRCEDTDFFHNGYGLFTTSCLLEIGGFWNVETLQVQNLSPCKFEMNGTAIYAQRDHNDEAVSIINGCLIESNDDEGVFVSNLNVRLRNNEVETNGRNGVWCYQGTLPRVEGNSICNNGGGELVGSNGTFENMDNGCNVINDIAYDGSSAGTSMFDAAYMDQFFLYIDDYDGHPKDVSGNTIPHSAAVEERFFPTISAFVFEHDVTIAEDIYDGAVENFSLGQYDTAEDSMKFVVEIYPETAYACNALTYLLYIENRTDGDFAGYRTYLQTYVDTTYEKLAQARDYLITQSYIYEKNYTEAIAQLEAVLANPPSEMDSTMALIDEGYCYMELSESGARNLPINCTVRTATMEEYQSFVRDVFRPLTTGGNDVPPVKVVLQGNYPNPFNPTTTIRYSIPEDGQVRLNVYNIRGQLVQRLVHEPQTAGRHEALWDGRNENQKPVASGVYLYRLECGGETRTRKMLLLK